MKKNSIFQFYFRMKCNENFYTSRQDLACHIWREQGQVTLTFHSLIYECNDQMSRGLNHTFVQFVSTNFPLKGCLLCRPAPPCQQWERSCSPWFWPLWVSDDVCAKLCYFINMFKNNADFIFGVLLIMRWMVMSV